MITKYLWFSAVFCVYLVMKDILAGHSVLSGILIIWALFAVVHFGEIIIRRIAR